MPVGIETRLARVERRAPRKEGFVKVHIVTEEGAEKLLAEHGGTLPDGMEMIILVGFKPPGLVAENSSGPSGTKGLVG
jgi:hypothetical protein